MNRRHFLQNVVLLGTMPFVVGCAAGFTIAKGSWQSCFCWRYLGERPRNTPAGLFCDV